MCEREFDIHDLLKEIFFWKSWFGEGLNMEIY